MITSLSTEIRDHWSLREIVAYAKLNKKAISIHIGGVLRDPDDIIINEIPKGVK